jgi:hypothetical protein
MTNPQKSKRNFYCEMFRVSRNEVGKLLDIKAQVGQLVLVLLVLSITLYKVYGKNFTFETIWNGYWPNFVGLVILIFVAPLWAFVKMFWVIPREYRKRQNEIKNLEKRFKSEVIEADISLNSFSLDSDKVYALLKVKNNEKSKKITGCRAKLTNFFISCNDKGDILDFTSSITAIEYPFFYWQENHDKQIDIEHSDEKILCIAVAKENRYLHLSDLKDEYDFPTMTSKEGKKFYEIKFKMELSGTIGNKNQVFYKDFYGRVFFTSSPVEEGDKTVFVDRIEFDEIGEKDLVETI